MKLSLFILLFVFFNPLVFAQNESTVEGMPGCDVSGLDDFELGKPVDVASLNCLLQTVQELVSHKHVFYDACSTGYTEIMSGCITNGVISDGDGRPMEVSLTEAINYCSDIHGELPKIMHYRQAYLKDGFIYPVSGTDDNTHESEYLKDFSAGNVALVRHDASYSSPLKYTGPTIEGRNDVFSLREPTTRRFRCYVKKKNVTR